MMAMRSWLMKKMWRYYGEGMSLRQYARHLARNGEDTKGAEEARRWLTAKNLKWT